MTLPRNTALTAVIDITADKGLCLHLSLNNDVPIRAVLLFGEGIFDNECYAIHPNGPDSSQLSAYFSPTRDLSTELFVKVIAGGAADRRMHVFEVNQLLPKFATFLPITSTSVSIGPSMAPVDWDERLPKSYVEFNLGQIKIDNLTDWLSESFVFTDNEWLMAGKQWGEKGAFTARFLCTRKPIIPPPEGFSPLVSLEVQPSGEGVLRMDNIESAGNTLQSICSYLSAQYVSSRAFFPYAMAQVETAIGTMDEKYEINDKLASDWAERLNGVREYVVRAEDSLAIGEISDARKLYARVAMLNRELVGQQAIRITSRDALLNSLKTINLAIDQFSRLRVGAPASQLIQECRRAIASDDLSSLPRLLQFGPTM